MLKRKLSRGLFAFLLSAVGVLGLVGPSRATLYVGTFDPAFGPGVPNLGFRGEGTFFVPDACLLLPDGFVSNAHPCSAGAMSMNSAFVELYDLAVPLATVDTAVFAPPPLALIGVEILANSLIGVFSFVEGPVAVIVPGIYTGNLWLEFRDIGEAGPNAAYIYTCDPDNEGCDSSSVSNPAEVTFTRIPEPNTVALLLAALGAGVAAKRRRDLNRHLVRGLAGPPTR